MSPLVESVVRHVRSSDQYELMIVMSPVNLTNDSSLDDNEEGDTMISLVCASNNNAIAFKDD